MANAAKELERPHLSELLEEVVQPSKHHSTFGSLVDDLDHHGLAVILVLFSIPSALPVPAAGYSTVLSIPLMIIGFHFLLRRERLWLPAKIRARSFEPQKYSKIIAAAMKIVHLIERFSKPRLSFLVNSHITHILLGVLICALALSMALPIPGTNTLPAGGIFLIGFSLLEDDGLLLAAGFLYSIAALCLTLFIIFFGYEVVKHAITSFF